MTQLERVVEAAKSYRGVCQVDFLGPTTVDGLPPITRLAARIFDAERQGYSFEVIGWRSKTKVYRLVSDLQSDGGQRAPSPRTGAAPSNAPSTPAVALRAGEVKGDAGERRAGGDHESGPASPDETRAGAGVPLELESERLFDLPSEPHYSPRAA